MNTGGLLGQEIWKAVPLPDFFDFYAVSSFGRVKSLSREVVDNNARYKAPRRWLLPEAVLDCTVSTKGYLRLTLQARGKKKSVGVHELVLLAFVGPKPARRLIRHKNGNKQDNRLDNIEYATPRRNVLDQHVLRERKNFLTPRELEAVKFLLELGVSGTSIAKRLKISDAAVSRIKNQHTYREE